MDEPWLIAIFTNAVVIIVALWATSVRATWKAASMKADIIQAITDHATEDAAEFAAIRDEIDATTRAFGETIQSIRQKVNDVELDVSKTYLRKEGYWKAHEQLIVSLKEIREEMRADNNRFREEFRADMVRLEQKFKGNGSPA